MPDKKTVQKFVHDLSNKIMILEGFLSVMTMDTKHILPENIKKMALTATAASKTLADMRGSLDQHDADTELVALTYCSKLRYSSSSIYATLGDIEKSSLNFNPKNEISGFLVYLDGNFIQRIEGARDKIEGLYRNILLDTRHSEVSLISFEKIQNRTFNGWQKLFNLSHGYADKVPQLINLISQNKERLLSANESLILLNLITDIADKSNSAQALGVMNED